MRNELRLSYADIRAMPSRACVRHIGMRRQQPGIPGASRAWRTIGTWRRRQRRMDRRSPFSCCCKAPGLSDGVCDIILEGADRGVPKEEPRPPGPISYARSIPSARAMEPDVLIAYQMNGRDLTPDHGYPLRAIVPGYYGMSSVKWLTDIVAATQPFQGYWQTSDYGYWDDSRGYPYAARSRK